MLFEGVHDKNFFGQGQHQDVSGQATGQSGKEKKKADTLLLLLLLLVVSEIRSHC